MKELKPGNIYYQGKVYKNIDHAVRDLIRFKELLKEAVLNTRKGNMSWDEMDWLDRAHKAVFDVEDC